MKSTYIIGEIGQNHNGSVDIAKLIVDLVSRPVREEVFNLELRPMDAVKMTKRDLNEELTDSQMNRPYDSPHSFGRTYGEHRAYLEADGRGAFRSLQACQVIGPGLRGNTVLKRLHVFIEALYARPPQGGESRPYQPAAVGSDGGNQDTYHPFHRYGRQEGTGRCSGELLPVITTIYPYCIACRNIPPGRTT